MFLPNAYSFLLIRGPIVRPSFAHGAGKGVFLPNSESFLLRRPVRSSRAAVLQTRPVRGEDTLRALAASNGTSATSNGVNVASVNPQSVESPDSEQSKIKDQGKRTFLKVASIAGASAIASQILSPKKASAFIMGSSPTTRVVGVKNSANARINPATEETVSTLATEATASTLLKTSDLIFDTGSLQVKVTSLPGAGSSSFSDAGDVAQG